MEGGLHLLLFCQDADQLQFKPCLCCGPCGYMEGHQGAMVQLFLGERQPVTCFVDNEILCWPWLPNLLMHTHIYSGFPGDTSGKEPASQFKRGKRCGFNPWVRKIWRRNWLPTPVFLPGKSHGQRSLAGYSPRGPKESDTTEGTQHTCIYIFTRIVLTLIFLLKRGTVPYLFFHKVLFSLDGQYHGQPY